jgi:speckle-type POZ protein
MAPETPTPTTMSTCRAETEQGKHVFEIFDYSQHAPNIASPLGMGVGKFIRSGTFSVGGHNWAIRFYPDGNIESNEDYISVYLQLLDKDAKVQASSDLMLVDQTTGLSTSVSKTEPRIFNSGGHTKSAPWTGSFMNRSKFLASNYLRDDHLTIQCIVTVRKDPHVPATKSVNQMEIPPSNIIEHFRNLLDSEEGADVTYSVGGENFAAQDRARCAVTCFQSRALRADARS